MTDRQKTKHLFYRLGFGFSAEEWRERQNWSPGYSINRLFKGALEAQTPAELANAPTTIDKADKMGENQRKKERENQRLLAARYNTDWVQRMGAATDDVFLERMCLFWHGHFACVTLFGNLAAAQLQTIRRHALGNFRDLTLAIARDVAMIRFLNNQQNRKEQPNENFARELMELFTIGRGHYTETDIKEAARAFTGWSSNFGGEFVFRKLQHDFDSKTFMGRTGDFDGTDIIDILLENRQTASFIANKVFRYFVNAVPVEAQVQELADVFYDSDYDIAVMMRHLVESDWFYAPQNVGTRIKSPVDLISHLLRSLNLTVNSEWGLVNVQKALGQVLFNPPNVAGWPGHRNWIDNSSLLLRLSLGALIFKAANVDMEVKAIAEGDNRNRRLKNLDAVVDLQPILKLTQGLNKDEQIEVLSELFLPAGVRVSKDLLLFENYSDQPEIFAKDVILRLLSLPEYQLC
ncbi:MAG: DUF1800 domain-containing protein [Phaeodactylibacter sp.]|nr:DUF1800 domain-containing protein [Phaeodactylibacter sp.]